MTKKTRKAIADLYKAGTTRAAIMNLLNVTTAQVQEVLGKSPRGRKPKGAVNKPVISVPKKSKPIQKVEIVDIIIVDESGSMSDVRRETTQGVRKYFQDMKDKQKQNNIPVNVSLILFGDSVQTLLPLSPLKEETGEHFRASANLGMTALLDALCTGIKQAKEWKEEKGVKYDYTITVFTDGQENSSMGYSLRSARELVKEVRSKGWTIAFVGPLGAERFAKSLDIEEGNTLTYDPSKKEDFTKSYAKMSTSRSLKSDAIAVGKFSSTNYFKED